MKRNLIAMFVLAAGAMFAQPRDGYGQPGYDPRYDDGYNQGYAMQAPPPAPVGVRGYRRPPMPGRGFVWVDGYWSFMRGRYVWTPGYWVRPPYAGAYWVPPRYSGGRFFVGFWGGGRGGRGGFGFGYRR